MNKTIIVSSLVLLLISNACGHKTEIKRGEVSKTTLEDDRFEVVTIDRCEYIVLYKKKQYAGMGGICHKANCRNNRRH
jgi:hypothetical protein